MGTYNGSHDCEVCKSEDSVIFRGDSRERSKSGYCLDCGLGVTQTTKWDDKGRYTSMVGEVFQWDLETINRYREYAENDRFANYEYEIEEGIIPPNSKYEPKWTPLKKLKKMNMKVFERLSKEMEEFVIRENKKYEDNLKSKVA